MYTTRKTREQLMEEFFAIVKKLCAADHDNYDLDSVIFEPLLRPFEKMAIIAACRCLYSPHYKMLTAEDIGGFMECDDEDEAIEIVKELVEYFSEYDEKIILISGTAH